MTVLSPLLLLGLAALAIPILLHLLRRQETRSLDFPALRYLTRTTREQARVIRLRQLLLLALRMMALALLVLAAARLILPLGGRDHPPAGLAIVIDNGLTSGAVTGTTRVLDSLLVRASEALDQTGEQDRVWIVEAGEPGNPSLPLTPSEARVRLAELSATDVAPDLGAAVDRAEALLEAGAPEVREVVLVSDLRAAAFSDRSEGTEARAVPVRIAPPPSWGGPNRGIDQLLVSGGLTPRAGDAGELQARVVGPGAEGALVRAYLGDALVGTGRAGADGFVRLPLPTVEAGWVIGRIEIEPDDLRGDDAAYFAFRAVPPPEVQVVGTIPTFLEDALAVLEDAGRIVREGTGAPQLRIFAAGAEAPEIDGTPLLLLPPDDAAQLPALNLVLGRAAPGWRLVAEGVGEDGEREIVGGSLSSLLPVLPRVRLAHSIESGDGAVAGTALLTLSDGRPWLLQLRGTSGPVFLLGSPLTLRASDLPGSAAMLPLMDALTTIAAGTREPAGVLAGEPLLAPEGARTVRLPSGTDRALGTRQLLSETGSAGIYEFLGDEGAGVGFVAVNASTPESLPALEPSEVARRLGADPDALTGDRPWPEAVLADRRGREVWRPLVAVLFLVLLMEGWLASYGGRGTRVKNRAD
ncbi:MAG: BatA domain-containing protein [Gemmatimonadota bacterium]